MADILAKFGADAALTITLNSLANNAVRESTVVNNSANLRLDSLIVLIIVTGASGVSSTGFIEIYGYGSIDDGTTYTDAATGANAVLTTLKNARLVAVASCNANGTTYNLGPYNVAVAFGGILPEYWGIFVKNRTGAALAAAGNSARAQGVYAQTS